MNGFIAIGAGALIFGFVIWLAIRSARKSGEADQQARQERLARENADRQAEIMAERRDPEETRRRLDEGTF